MEFVEILLDTNVVVDLNVALLLSYICTCKMNVSYLVYENEIKKIIKNINDDLFNIIKESSAIVKKAQDYQSKYHSRISVYDAINMAIAEEKKLILITGDMALAKIAKENEIDCFGTLFIIKKLIDSNVIAPNEAINGLSLLKNDNNRRIPSSLIDELIKELRKESVK